MKLQRHWLILSLSPLLGAALAASAQTPIQLKPGLWEHGIQVDPSTGKAGAAMAQMQEALASLPPAQRRAMEDMLARQGVGMGAQGTTVKVCLTPEDVARDHPPQEPGCTQTSRRSGNTWQVSFQCKGPPPSSGDGQLVLQSPQAYTGKFTVRTTEQGQGERLQMTQRGRWISADCGGVRPAGAPR